MNCRLVARRTWYADATLSSGLACHVRVTVCSSSTSSDKSVGAASSRRASAGGSAHSVLPGLSAMKPIGHFWHVCCSSSSWKNPVGQSRQLPSVSVELWRPLAQTGQKAEPALVLPRPGSHFVQACCSVAPVKNPASHSDHRPGLRLSALGRSLDATADHRRRDSRERSARPNPRAAPLNNSG